MENDRKTIVIKEILSLCDNAKTLNWKKFHDGIEIYPIYADESGCSSALLKYAVGASIPLHQHGGYEHILILDGSQSDEKQRYTKGDLIISPPGSSHSIKSDIGCIVLAIWERPVRFIS
jgi:predicted ChrR family anti-sigma factor